MHDNFSGIKYDVNSTVVTGFIVPVIINRLLRGEKYSHKHVFCLFLFCFTPKQSQVYYCESA